MQPNNYQLQQKSSGLKPIISFPDVFDFLKSCQEKGTHPSDIGNMLQIYSKKIPSNSMDKWMFEELAVLMHSMTIDV